MVSPNTPRGILEAVISCRPMIERQIVEQVAFHCSLNGHWAEVATANALTSLIQDGRIEQFNSNPNAYRITAAVQVEKNEERERKAKDATTKRTRAEAPLDRLIRIAKAKEAEARERQGAK